MKTVPANMASLYAAESQTLARCWKITRRDAQVFGFTSVDIDLELDGLTYHAATGFTGSAIAYKADLSVDNMEATGLIDDDRISVEDMEAGLWDEALVEVFDVDYLAPAAGRVLLPGWKLGNVSPGRQAWIAEIRSLTQALQQPFGELVSPNCQANLGDERCKVNLAPLTVSAAVTAVTSNSEFTASSLVQPAGWFTFGRLTWTSGQNAGRVIEVGDYAAPGQFELVLPMPYPILIGDSFSVSPGCNKIHRIVLDASMEVTAVEGDCKNKYDNVINFRGFDAVPGPDRMIGDANYA